MVASCVGEELKLIEIEIESIVYLDLQLSLKSDSVVPRPSKVS